MTELVLHEACAIGDYESLDDYLKTGKHDPNCRDEEWGGKAPLHWAAIRGSIECTRILLSIGVNGNVKMDNGWTPAHCAAETGKIHILRALHNAGVRLNEVDNFGDTALRVAQMYSQVECIRFLQEVYDEYNGVPQPSPNKQQGQRNRKKTKPNSQND